MPNMAADWAESFMFISDPKPACTQNGRNSTGQEPFAADLRLSAREKKHKTCIV